MVEVWKPVPSFENIYEVSNYGNVRSLDRVVLDCKGHRHVFSGQPLNPNYSAKYPSGRCCFSYTSEGKMLRFKVPLDRLVLAVFSRDKFISNNILHKDGNPINCRIDNLINDISGVENYLDELWVDIPNHPEYQISTYGRIKVKSKIWYDSVLKCDRIVPECIKQPSVQGVNDKSRSKRLHINLITNGVQYSFQPHRLVAQVFIPNPENKPQINHIDGNPLNNHISNLEWVTQSENMKHAFAQGLNYTAPERIAFMNKRHSIKVYCVELDTEYPSIKEASQSTGVCKERVVYSIKHNQTLPKHKLTFRSVTPDV